MISKNGMDKTWLLPLMKGEIKEGVGVASNLSNHPLHPLLHKEGEHAFHVIPVYSEVLKVWPRQL
jgi:hypothetical protein